MQKLSLKDLEVRYANIRKSNPDVKTCSVVGCENPRDSTTELGESTCCAYHRLLFDFWSADVYRGNVLKLSRKGRRMLFSKWMKKMGKETCDNLALMMAAEPINWAC